MERQRELKQLSTVYMFHPYCEHKRWHHSIGVAGIVKYFLHAQSPETMVDPHHQYLLVAAALLHDIGHPAWCHVGEVFCKLRGAPLAHDDLSAQLVEGAREYDEYFKKWELSRARDVIDDRSDRKMIASLIKGNPAIPPHISVKGRKRCLTKNEKDEIRKQTTFMGNMIKGHADFDRADFLMRDSFLSSSLPGLIDVRRIAENLGIVDTATGTKILAYTNLNFAEAMMTARELLYPGLYLEARNLVAEELLIRAFHRAFPEDMNVLDFWFSTDEDVMKSLDVASNKDKFVDRVCKLMRARQTYDLVEEITLLDQRLDSQSIDNIRYLGSDEGRPRVLDIEKEVCDDVGIAEGDIVIGSWLWKKPKIAEAPLLMKERLTTVSRESKLLEVIDTDRYINSRSRLIIGMYRKVKNRRKIVDKILENLREKTYIA